MELEHFELPKMLHLLIRKFISKLKKYIEDKNIDENKIFVEISKRICNISQGIRLIAVNALSKNIADVPVSDDILNLKIQSLLNTYLQEDLTECALNYDSWQKVSEEDLHDLLYWFSASDKCSMSSFYMSPISSISLEGSQTFLPTHPFSPIPKKAASFDFAFLSSEFDASRKQFEEDLSQLKVTVDNASPSSDFKCSELDFKSINEISPRSTISCISNDLDSAQESPKSSAGLFYENLFDQDSYYQNFSGTSWEGRMKQFVPYHLYSSELVEKEISFNITEEDSQLFRCLYNSTTSISETELINDILDLLIGIPSHTFLFDHINKEYQLKSHTHLGELSHESTLRFVEKFVDCGMTFLKLHSFSTQVSQNEGFILRGLKNGIQQVLKIYSEYIVSVKTKKPNLLFLKSDVLEAAQSLNILGTICRLKNEENDFIELPKGLGLLSYLNECLWPHRRKENAIIIGVVLKYAYIPYFSFLDKWMNEGICYDPYREFQIIEDYKFLDMKDEFYWRLAYTENTEDLNRNVPFEIQNYATDILQCGKNMRLLKICCPQLYSLDYMSSIPPPPLSMLFSYSAATAKAEKCLSYVHEKDKAESENLSDGKEISEEDILLQRQCLVSQSTIISQINAKSRSPHFNNLFKLDWRQSKNALRRCYSVQCILQFTSPLFSDIIYENIGILFSSCDYNFKSKNNYEKIADSEEILKQNKLKKVNTENVCFSKLDKHYNCFKKSPSDTTNRTHEENLYYNKIISSSHLNLKSYQILPLLKDREDDTLREDTSSVESRLSNREILPGTFMNNLASLLINDYGDTKQDVYSCLQLSSLQSLMFYTFRAVLDMRMHIVKKVITDYVMNQLKFQDLLVYLKNTYLLLDESFSRSLLEKLFPWVLKCQTVQQFSNWSVLNKMFFDSILEINVSNCPILSSGSVNVVDIPENDILERNEFLHFFQFEFQISWPLNIIIHKACITSYMNIFSFLLELDFLCWMLGRTWRSLMFHNKSGGIQNSPQFREIMLSRFDMHQFINVLRNCIRQDLQGPVWDFLTRSLNTEELSIDALEDIHIQYLDQVLTRCFLTKETQILHELIVVISRQIYKFCSWTLESEWVLNNSNKQYEISTFDNLTSVCEIYKKYQKVFYERILKLTVIRKSGLSRKDGFKYYLETILESKRKFW